MKEKLVSDFVGAISRWTLRFSDPSAEDAYISRRLDTANRSRTTKLIGLVYTATIALQLICLVTPVSKGKQPPTSNNSQNLTLLPTLWISSMIFEAVVSRLVPTLRGTSCMTVLFFLISYLSEASFGRETGIMHQYCDHGFNHVG